MDKKSLTELLQQVENGEMSVTVAVENLKNLDSENIGYAVLDHHRQLRKGFCEVIYGAGKTAAQISQIMLKLAAQADGNVMATKVDTEKAGLVLQAVPEATYFEQAGILALIQGPQQQAGQIVIACAGTSDIFVAEEAAVTCCLMGAKVTRLYDVGVAGLHRILNARKVLDAARVIIVVAGMDGALPSVVGGLVDKPIIAVPTSVGYGASFQGVAPLLTMLNCCSPGVSVVNIDNGFGAAYSAVLINKGDSANDDNA